MEYEIITCKPCMVCKKSAKVKMTRNQYLRLMNTSDLIQDIFSDWDAPSRELIITGTHPDCWTKVFGDDEEEEEYN